MAPKRGQVIDGYRSGGNQAVPAVEVEGDGYVSTKRQQALADERAAAAAPEAAPFVEYQSRFRNYRISKRINRDIIVDGSIVRENDQNAQFSDFIFRTNDPKMIQYLESRKTYGVGLAFWRTQDLTDQIMFDNVDKTIGMLRAAAKHSPNAIAALAKELGKEDFDILSSLASYADSKKPAEKQTA